MHALCLYEKRYEGLLRGKYIQVNTYNIDEGEYEDQFIEQFSYDDEDDNIPISQYENKEKCLYYEIIKHINKFL